MEFGRIENSDWMILSVSMVPTFSCPVLDDILCSTCELCFCICVRVYLLHSDNSASRTRGQMEHYQVIYDTRCILMFCINETCVIHTSYRALMKKQLDLMGAYLRRTNALINPSPSIVPHQWHQAPACQVTPLINPNDAQRIISNRRRPVIL